MLTQEQPVLVDDEHVVDLVAVLEGVGRPPGGGDGVGQHALDVLGDHARLRAAAVELWGRIEIM